MDRRRFLQSSARMAGVGLLAPWAGSWAAPAAAAEEAVGGGAFPDLALARGGAAEATRRAVGAIGGMGRFLKPGQVVVIKPNASFECPPDWGATSHPEVLAAVMDLCFETGARRVLVVDHTMKGAERCFRRTGTADAVARFPKAKLLSLDEEKHYREISVPDGKALRATRIPSVLGKADLFINLPTAKSHSATGVSLGLKNLMGLVWDRHAFHNDFDLHQGIADLATVLKPQLTILDAVRLLKTGGPAGPGEVDEFNGVIAGVDPVAVDAYGSGLSVWNGQTYAPDQVAYLRHAADHGLGTLDLETLNIAELG